MQSIPNHILLPIILNGDEEFVFHSSVRDIILHLERYFGIKPVFLMLSDIISYLIQKDNEDCLSWILQNTQRYEKYFSLFLRYTLIKIEEKLTFHENPWKSILLPFIEKICKKGDLELFEYIFMLPKIFPYIPYNIADIGCKLGAKYGHMHFVQKYIKNSNHDVNYDRMHLAFMASLSENKDIIYTNLFQIYKNEIIDGLNEKHYKCAEMGSFIFNENRKDSLSFLLQNDPRIFHISPRLKLVYFKDSSNTLLEKRFYLQTPLSMKYFVSKLHFANYCE